MGGQDEGFVESAKTSKASTAEREIAPAERPVGKARPAMPAGPSVMPSGVVIEETPAADQPKKYRYHENNGEIHFHGTGNESNLKAAIPAADWFTGWTKLARLEPFNYVDLKNKTMFSAVAFVENGVLDVFLEVTPLQVGGAFAGLKDFTEKRRK